MYLRLKTRAEQSSRPPSNVAACDGSLRAQLLRRHYASFDWQNGGPLGFIKFIDIHQLELAVRLMRRGSTRDDTIVRHYASGLRALLGDGTKGAAHYASGSTWSQVCRGRSLAGQAVALKAMALIGTAQAIQNAAALTRSMHDFSLALIRTGERVPENAYFAVSATGQFRDNAWYALALKECSELFGCTDLHEWAETQIGALLECSRQLKLRSSRLTLADGIALAELRMGRRRHCRVVTQAAELISQLACDYSHPDGGYSEKNQPGLEDANPVDIDCTIDFVRLTQLLVHKCAQHQLQSVLDHGMKALRNPAIAFARTNEAGICLVELDCEKNFAATRMAHRIAPAAIVASFS